METLYNGYVKFFNRKKGYGFIEYSDEDQSVKEIFVHASGIYRKHADNKSHENLVDKEPVVFAITEGPRGPVATNVVRTHPNTQFE